MSEVLALHATGLLSKWGFNDGAMPDHVWDAAYTAGIRAPHAVWDWVLTGLARDYLLPELSRQGYRIVMENWSLPQMHNPLRAESVNGTPRLPDADYERDARGDLLPDVLVEIPMSEVVERLQTCQPDAGCVFDLIPDGRHDEGAPPTDR